VLDHFNYNIELDDLSVPHSVITTAGTINNAPILGSAAGSQHPILYKYELAIIGHIFSSGLV
jgi:hypothetical protein